MKSCVRCGNETPPWRLRWLRCGAVCGECARVRSAEIAARRTVEAEIPVHRCWPMCAECSEMALSTLGAG